MSVKSATSYRKTIAALAITAAMAGTVLSTAPFNFTAPANAEAVNVTGVEQKGFADLVEQVRPAVVSVRVKSEARQADSRGSQLFDAPGFDSLPDGHPLKRFFRDFGMGPKGHGDDNSGKQRQWKRGESRPSQARPVSQGSGFFISEDGYVVTNHHVVSSGDVFSIVSDDGKEYDAKLIGTDPRTDLAVLKVDGEKDKFTYVAFGDDDKVRVGDWVVAVGNPFGLGGTVTSGIVSARGRDIGAGPYDDFIQIDAAVNKGNSGGPAFNLKGEVIGINTAIFSPSGGSVGIAFAIPSATAKQVVEQLIEKGSVDRGFIGVQIQPVSKEIADSLGLGEAKGALVVSPQEDGPAAKAGIKAGDVITAVNGETIQDARELSKKIANIVPGEKVDLTVWSDGKANEVSMTIGALPEEEKSADTKDRGSEVEKGENLEEYGLFVTPNDDKTGLTITDIDPESVAAERGIRRGDAVVSVNNQPVKSLDDVKDAIEAAKKDGRKAVLFQLKSNDQNRFVALPIEQ